MYRRDRPSIAAIARTAPDVVYDQWAVYDNLQGQLDMQHDPKIPSVES
jgi:hypothetical protein